MGRAHGEALAPEPTRPSPQQKTPKRVLLGKVVGCSAYNRSVQQPAARTRTATTGNLDRTTDKSAEVSAVTHSKANVVAINSPPCESLARGPAVPDASCHPADGIVVKPTAWRVSDSATRAVHIGANCRNVWLSRHIGPTCADAGLPVISPAASPAGQPHSRGQTRRRRAQLRYRPQGAQRAAFLRPWEMQVR